jgi:tetratricopeptide (TPR) repeat protein
MSFSPIRTLSIATAAGLCVGFVFIGHSAGKSAADIGMPPAAKAAIARLKVKPAQVDTPWRKAMRVRAAIKRGNYSAARRMTAEIAAASQPDNWRHFPFDDFIKYVSDLSDPAYAAHLDAWVAQAPNDALPLLIRVQFECDIAWFKRGHHYVSETQPEHMASFVRLTKKALADARHALKLDDGNPYGFYLTLRILQGAGGPKDMKPVFAQAIARHPAYYPSYKLMLQSLAPKWGGSLPAMYVFVGKYAGEAAKRSPLKMLYLELYRDLIDVTYNACGNYWPDKDKTARCFGVVAEKIISPDLQAKAQDVLQLYNHTDKHQFAIVLYDILSDLIRTPGASGYSGAMLESAAGVMGSNTQLVEEGPSRNNYIIDRAVSDSWYAKGFYDNALKKDEEALKDVDTTEFASEDEKALAVAGILDDMAAVYDKIKQPADAMAYEQAAVSLGRGNGNQIIICYGYYRLKQYKQAISTCSKAIEEQTDFLRPRYWRGSAYRDSGEIDAALRDFTAVADSEDDFRTSAAIDLSMIYFKRKQNDAALDVLNKYTYLYDPNLNDKTDIGVSYNNRCYAYMKLGKLKKALADCTASLRYASIPDAIRKEKELLQRLKGHEKNM